MEDERIELISLCSPNRRLQAAEAIKCMKAGKHVLAEKPCAMTEEELDEIIKVSRETGKQFHEMAGTVFVQPFYALRKLVLSGELGEIVQIYTQKSYALRINARPQNEDVDGGLLRQVGVHNVRFVEHITGLKVKDISAVQTRIGNISLTEGLHTAVSFMMVLENGAVGSGVANYMNQTKGFGSYRNECIRIWGTKGYAEIMDGGRKSRVIIQDEYRGELDTKEVPETYFARVVKSILGIEEMPFDLVEELHPTRIVLKAADTCSTAVRKKIQGDMR